MTRVTWTPGKNSEREALRRFPEWELINRNSLAVHGVLCFAICPVGLPSEGRWVPVERVNVVAED